MKKPVLVAFLSLMLIATSVKAQDFKESVQPLTKKSIKGFLYDVHKDGSGNSLITYKIKEDKKSDEISYEEYSFDKDLKFLGTKDVKEKKEQKEDYQSVGYNAYVGGTTSFDALSMKLKLNKIVVQRTWNHEKQRYINGKIISNETIKPHNDAGKVYYGYVSYTSPDETKNDVFIIAKVEAKSKKDNDQFLVLLFNDKLEIKEKPMEMNGSYSLVFCEQVSNSDVVAIFAPNKGAPDVSKYIYFQYDIQGNLKNRVEFKSPASALLLTYAAENNGNIYFFGTSTKSSDPFDEVFKEYASIYNPGGANLQYLKWEKGLDEKMESFHILKFSGSQLAFASTTKVSDFKSKFKPAPGDKGASPYKGISFFIENFFVTPNEEYFIAGQLKGKISQGTGNKVDSYEDLLCFHFDKTGSLKAQYGVGKINNDKKSEIFSMLQNFYLSSDGKSVYWEILEVKGVKGYEDFLSAYYGVPSYYALFFPRIAIIDLASSTLGAFKTLGNEKYYLRRDFTSNFDKTENNITYIGNDEDYKNLWIGKMQMK